MAGTGQQGPPRSRRASGKKPKDGVFEEMVKITLEGGSAFLREAVAKVAATGDADAAPAVPADPPADPPAGHPVGATGNACEWGVVLQTEPGVPIGIEAELWGEGTGCLVVTAITPGSACAECPLVAPGDLILEVNKSPAAGAADTIGALAGNVSLTLSTAEEPDRRLAELLRADQRGNAGLVAQKLGHVHDVLLLTLGDGDEPETAPTAGASPAPAPPLTPTPPGDRADREDSAGVSEFIAYQYSKSALFGGPPGGVAAVHRAFLTLFLEMDQEHVQQALGQDSLRASSVQIRGEDVHVVFSRVSQQHVLAVAASTCMTDAAALAAKVTQTVPLIRVLHGSASRAFDRADRVPRLDVLFHQLFRNVCRESTASTDGSTAGFLGQFDCPFGLHASANEKIEVNDALYLLESNSSKARLDRAEACLTVGECLFVHGAAFHSTIPNEAMAVVAKVCEAYGFLEATRGEPLAMNSIVTWMGVHNLPGMPASTKPKQSESSREPLSTFLVVGAMKTAVMAVVLQAWHGGGRSQLKRPKGPDRLHMKDVLLKLHLLDVNGTLSRLTQKVPTGLLRPQAVLPPDFDPPKLSSFFHELQAGSPKRRPAPKKYRKRLGSKAAHAGGDSSGGSSGGSRASLGSGLGSQALLENPTDTAACFGPVLDHVYLHEPAGIVCLYAKAMPLDATRYAARAAISKQFFLACKTVKRVLDRQVIESAPFRPATADLGKVYEYGVLFKVHESRATEKQPSLMTQPLVEYWAVGRRFRELDDDSQRRREEAYVCFRDGAPQSVIELAFALQREGARGASVK